MVFILTALLFVVCEEKVFTLDVDCNECYTEKPDSVDLIFHWTKNEDYPEIPVVLYKGTVENGEFIDTFFCFEDPAYVWVKSNEEYSAKAIYESSERTVIVVDGTKQKLKHVSDACDDPCWIITNEELRLQLHF
ncbi:MAG: hypothetical protein PVF73_10605 [Bacteroidales bacterium]